MNALRDVAAIVVHWNTPELALRTVESLAGWVVTRRAYVVVVDNASHRGARDALAHGLERLAHLHDVSYRESHERKQHPTSDLLLLLSCRNRGFAGGANLALRYLVGSSLARYVWLLNSDAAVAPNALDELLRCASNAPQVGVWGTTICDPERPNTISIAGGARYMSLLDLNRYPLRGRTFGEAPQSSVVRPRLDYVSGASLFIPADVVRSVGVLDDTSLLYYEDLDFCRKVRAAGYSLGWCRNSVVYHRGSGSTVIQDGRRSPVKEYHASRAALSMMRRQGGFTYPIAAGARLLRRSLATGLTGRADLLGALLRAYQHHFIQKQLP